MSPVRNKFILVIFLSLVFFSFSVNLALAWSQCDSENDCPDGKRIESCCPPEPPEGGLVPCGTPCCPCRLCDFFIMIDRIIDFLLFKIVPVLAALMIAIGGGMYILSFNQPANLSRAKSLFTAVVIGLLIIYGAWLLVNTFLMFIGVADWTGLKSGWWQINCD